MATQLATYTAKLRSLHPSYTQIRLKRLTRQGKTVFQLVFEYEDRRGSPQIKGATDEVDAYEYQRETGAGKAEKRKGRRKGQTTSRQS